MIYESMTRADYEWLPGYTQSQIKSFWRCPATWLAEVNGNWQRPNAEHFELGKLFEAMLFREDQAVEALKETSEFLFTKGTKNNPPRLTAGAQHVELMVARVRELLPGRVLEGHRSIVLTGTLGGHKVKGEVDLIDPDTQAIRDTKAMASFGTDWVREKGRNVKKPWWQVHLYDLQAALYTHLAEVNYDIDLWTYELVAVSKQKPLPDVQWLRLDTHPDLLELRRRQAVSTMTTMEMVRTGEAEARRCEVCDYCIATRTWSRPLMVLPNFDADEYEPDDYVYTDDFGASDE